MKDTIKRFGGRTVWFCLFFMLAQCGPPSRKEWKLLSPEFAGSWEPSGMEDEGRVSFSDNECTLEPGRPMSGARFNAWQPAGLPVTRYAIEFDAMRVEGNDFFGTVTFPVNDDHVSFIVGGWGGTLVGLSCIDELDASENATRGNGRFDNGRWYHILLEVRDAELRAWIDDRLFVNVSIVGHKLGLRVGDIGKCAPFGFASYLSKARIRDVVIRRLVQ